MTVAFSYLWTIHQRCLSLAAGALATVASIAAPSVAGIVTFGSGGNTFNMEFVTIGNPGNAPDTRAASLPVSTTLGSVGYTYGIGKFEVSRDMITKYNANFGTANNLVITMGDLSDFGGNGVNRPAGGIAWNEAARFVNWLNDSQGFAKAYKFADGSATRANIELWTSGEAGYNASNRYRNSLAKYVLPDYNEWYKAAFYKPTNSTYYDYANGRNTAPNAVASGDGDNTAVYLQPLENGPADVDKAGGLSPYGVMGLHGNVWEWEESSFDLLNSSGSSMRAYRGGSWDHDRADAGLLRGSFQPVPNTSENYGFRVVILNSDPPPAVPEPSMMVIGTLFGLGGLAAKRRMKK